MSLFLICLPCLDVDDSPPSRCVRPCSSEGYLRYITRSRPTENPHGQVGSSAVLRGNQAPEVFSEAPTSGSNSHWCYSGTSCSCSINVRAGSKRVCQGHPPPLLLLTCLERLAPFVLSWAVGMHAQGFRLPSTLAWMRFPCLRHFGAFLLLKSLPVHL